MNGRKVAFDRMAAKIEEAKRAHATYLNQNLYADITLAVRWHGKPTSRRVRAWWRIKGYLSTLWLALKGRELAEPEDWDY